MSSNEEQQLILAAKNGDRAAFAKLYEQNVRQIYAYVRQRVSEDEIAEDMTSDVFVRAIETLDRYEQRGVPFLGWLYHIAHGLVVDYYRRQKKRSTEQPIEDIPLVAEHNPEAAAFANIRQEDLLQVIRQLTEEQQQVIMLRFIQGYNLSETAELMGKKPNAIKALQFRAVRALSRLYGVNE